MNYFGIRAGEAGAAMLASPYESYRAVFFEPGRD